MRELILACLHAEPPADPGPQVAPMGGEWEMPDAPTENDLDAWVAEESDYFGDDGE